MVQSSLFAAYLAATRPIERGAVPKDVQPRPSGALIWAICASSDHRYAMDTLSRRLSDDGEAVTIVSTLASPADPDVPTTPNTRHATRAFLQHWQPQLILWVGGSLDPAVVFEISKSDAPAVMIEADGANIAKTPGRHVPGLLRQCLQTFAEILTIDDADTPKLLKAGANPDTLHAIGVLDDAVAPPPCDDTVRSSLTTRLSARPMWLAADIPLAEVATIAAAYRHAARRAHKTLLIVTPRHGDDTKAMEDAFRCDGLSIACRHHGEQPKEATQIYVVDTDEGLGLWCRLSSITYLGGSLSDGISPDPFVPALVGSAIVTGPHQEAHQTHFDRLLNVGAIKQVSTSDKLGGAIEDLLATDLAAQQALAAWDVTSQGADATNDLMSVIYTYLDQVNT
ncbi:MAG: 3-deoxy-D-manno-octulosonic-acid transferase [Gammaproteobacteria bacterium]|jgi:3-deoxy-D-manno-octulosonic-acid transferase